MFNTGYGGTGDFEALARQYWSAWGNAMRQAGLGAVAPPPPPPQDPWHQAMDWWSRRLPQGPSQVNDTLGRFNRQARDWFGQMQQVAAQFAGRDSSPSEIGQAWRQALGARGANPFPEMFKAMSGKGLHGLDEWTAQMQPFLDSLRQDAERWLHLPAFGQHREHHERLQALVQAQLDYQERNAAFNVLMGKCAQRAFEVFEDKLAACEEPGRQISSARGLFDLWIDAAEQAYAEIALSQEFREACGALTNAQMRLRAGVQREVELMCAQFGMPTRTEVDSAHRKIAELERALRRAKAQGTAGDQRRAAPAAIRERERRPQSRTAQAQAEPELDQRTPADRLAAKQGATGTPDRSDKPRQAPGETTARERAAAPATVREEPARGPAARKADGAEAREAGAKKPAVQAGAAAADAPPKGGDAETAARKPKPAKPHKPAGKSGKHAADWEAARAKAGVVSMKDWVARYSAAQSEENAPAKGRKRSRK
ncbi:MAG TPA: class III poly(R)-hydroxyalkanoic acid synthase subunit PhaE [Pseudoxanthomonas sp.]|nr:class III poly(R)-hydroxyalkanoic acid synthase subunit PhaE [Pseudoxanthomonas sp.]